MFGPFFCYAVLITLSSFAIILMGKCNSLNYSRASSQDLNSFSSKNPYSSLNSSPDKDFIPTPTSTPSKTSRPPKVNKIDKPLKIALNNFRSIREKKPQLHSFVDFNKPDIIVGTETWLSPDVFDGEYFPLELGYTVYRRLYQKGGGVIILIKSTYLSEEKPEFKTNWENLWAQ